MCKNLDYFRRKINELIFNLQQKMEKIKAYKEKHVYRSKLKFILEPVITKNLILNI